MLRTIITLCALVFNHTQTAVEVCCAIDQPFYGTRYEYTPSDYCSNSSNRLMGYGHRTQVDNELCAPTPIEITPTSPPTNDEDVDFGFELLPLSIHAWRENHTTQ